MRVISVIEDKEIIKKMLKHLNLWDRKARPPPKMKDSSLFMSFRRYSFSHNMAYVI